MKSSQLSRMVILGAVIATALVASSCEGGAGVGVSAGYPTRWGGTSGPPVFVGGPAY